MRRITKRGVVWLLMSEAKLVVRKYKPRIIAVTGSVGKTSTKDAIYTVLAEGAHARKSEKSFNSEVGVPLTILGCPNAWDNPLLWIQNLFHGLLLIIFSTTYPEWLVLEIGADTPGDIRSISAWLPVDIAVITRLPEMPVHVEFFGSPDEVIEEKASLITALKPGGTLVLFGDEERARALAERAEKRGCGVVFFGLSEPNDVRGTNFAVATEPGNAWPVGMQCDIELKVSGGKKETIPVVIRGVLGAHPMLSLVAAAAVGAALGKSVAEMGAALSSYVPPPGRMRLLPGLKGSLLIDDTYNSSPAAAEAALGALTLISNGRHIAVLGDMLELGRHSVEEHRKLGTLAARSVDILAVVGPRARDIAQGALDAELPDSTILHYDDSRIAGEELKNLIGPGDVILIKGSQSTRMERAVEELMHEPERAREFLVRQDSEWKKR